MSIPVRLRVAAELDVVGHAEFIQRDSVEAALRFLDAVDATFALLGASPEIYANFRRFSCGLVAGTE